MVVTPLGDVSVVLVCYVVAFAVAALSCLVSARRARRIEHPATRRGLVALLVGSAGWAGAHLGYLLVPGADLKVAFYVVGLVVGLATVGPWLYFCSAYSGRALHRDVTIRRVAIVGFLAIVLLKLTNPIHHLYFTTAHASEPFPHLAIQHGLVHWLVMGLSYALAIVGYFMLYERLSRVSQDTRPLLVLVTITGLPIGLDVLGFASPYLLDVTHEPLGVAVFAVGVLFVYLDRFEAIRVVHGSEDPVIVLDADDVVREYNLGATEQFPTLADVDAVGEPLWSTLPAVARALDRSPSIIEREVEGDRRFFHVSETNFGSEGTELGRIISLTDVTEGEQYRRELERQNDRLEQFASMVSHDLRNPLNVATGELELSRETSEDEHLDRVAEALERMDELIDDVLTLARQGQPIDETEPVSLAAVARQSWDGVDTQAATLDVEDDIRFEADRNRLQQLFENLIRNAIEHGGADVTVSVGALADSDGFYVADDGPGIPDDHREDVFESGFTTNTDGTGFGLAIVAEVAEAHGWSVRVTEGESGGARFEVTGVDRRE